MGGDANPNGGASRIFSGKDAAMLRIASRLLRSDGWHGGPVQIKPKDGENFMLCVQRVAANLPIEQKDQLRALVLWVYDYETSGGEHPPEERP